MSIGSILSSLTGTSSHAAFSTQSVTSSASEELQKLFAKLHMDAIASTATSSTSTSSATSGTSSTSTSSSGGAVTDIVHGLRHLLDGGISVAKEARTAAKTAASIYAHGGIGGIAAQVVDKVA
ncbi:hypothetical protein HZF05_02750 [Sphingomonas sp. CGMCC 1.13654]|uniref:Uncharacterized protein n=1 Tax=Sphingomonas chungangi TaxID=2683589 RepID=A0A838L5Z6_9SPHN|nr:hypothetical protein [Sphingomonas chungangi]MBA2933008.1 hypothetical protein [Sphingomonas chungangi]MVW56628.1 hypothetical protein [Sphingomonas chungangi]